MGNREAKPAHKVNQTDDGSIQWMILRVSIRYLSENKSNTIPLTILAYSGFYASLNGVEETLPSRNTAKSTEKSGAYDITMADR